MRLFLYYALHTFKNSIRKFFKTWLIIFIIIFTVAFVFGVLAASFDEDAEPEDEYTEVEDGELFEDSALTPSGFIELLAGGFTLFMLFFSALNADKNGSRIFQPADVSILFPSPMRPQSVLMFRLSTQLGVALLAGVYVLFQLPNLVENLGLTVWAALSLVVAESALSAAGLLLQMLLYTLSSTHAKVKKLLRPTLYGLAALLAVSFVMYAGNTGGGYLAAVVGFFNAPFTRYIPILGSIKGFCAFAVEGDALGIIICSLLTVLPCALLAYIIWHIEADFYEDAMAKSEETAELLAAQQGRSTAPRRKKDRSEKLHRDGVMRGSGASVFFHKAMYNRFRFAHLHVFTKTSEFYLAVGLLVSVISLIAEMDGMTVLALILAGLVFFRSLGDPVVQDVSQNIFIMAPASVTSKYLWSLLAGVVNCLLDLIPALVAGVLIMGSSPLSALMWLPLIASIDFYSSSVITFIGLSTSVKSGKMLKQIVALLFIYFGLIPTIICGVAGFAMDAPAAGFAVATVINAILGLVFSLLTPLFIEPGGGRAVISAAQGVDTATARCRFSRVGMAAFTMMAAGLVLQVAAMVGVPLLWPGVEDHWLTGWLLTFAPLYLAAIPLGLLVLRPVPKLTAETSPLRTSELLSAIPIAFFLMYAGNIVGILVNLLISSLLPVAPVNPVEGFATSESPILAKILFMAVLPPLIEEFVFRRQIIDRTRRYGEKLSIIFSALMFGLFHGNLAQFFYALALGLLLGYIYVRTGRLRYCVGLHMLVNFVGSIATVWLQESLDSLDLDALMVYGPSALSGSIAPLIFAMVFVVTIVLLFISGLVLFFIRSRRTVYLPAESELPRGRRFTTAFINPGVIIFTLLCLASMVVALL